MMWTTIGKIMALAGLSRGFRALLLLGETSIASGQIFQWTDVKGIIHFTDNPDSIPDSNSSALIVRKDMDTKSRSRTTTFDPLPAVILRPTSGSTAFAITSWPTSASAPMATSRTKR